MESQYASYDGRRVGLPRAQKLHIGFFHPEVLADESKIELTIGEPEVVAAGATEDTRVFYRFFSETLVTAKYLAMVIRLLNREGFIVTAYFTERIKRGRVIWRRTS